MSTCSTAPGFNKFEGIEIVGVYAITDELDALYERIWGSDYVDPNDIAAIRACETAKMVRIDHVDQPYRPDPQNYPDREEWLWADPEDQTDTDYMIRLSVDVTEQSNGDFKESLAFWMMGQYAGAIIVYKRKCCPEYSTMICAVNDDGELELKIIDSARTKDVAKQLFAARVKHDESGEIIEHTYDHVVNKDSTCHHAHHPERLMRSAKDDYRLETRKLR